MAGESSFDVVSEIDDQELRNALDQVRREVQQRYDFKGAFVELTQAIAERWPDHQPYGGTFEEIVPHLTVAYGAPIPRGLAERLPVRVRAEEVWLMSRVARRWTRRRAFPLGPPAAGSAP